MPADKDKIEAPEDAAPEHAFGKCCDSLKEALEAEDFEPLITVGDDGVLYMTVGLIELEDEDDSGLVDHPMFHCPFCGTKLQNEDEVRAKVAAHEGGDANGQH